MKLIIIFVLLFGIFGCNRSEKKPEPIQSPVIEPIPQPEPTPEPIPEPPPQPVMKFSCLSLGQPVQFATLDELKQVLSKKYPDTCLRVDNRVVVMGFGPCYSCRSINK